MKKRSDNFAQFKRTIKQFKSQKRGQLTLFVIISILVIVTLIIYTIISNQKESNFSENFLSGKGLSKENEKIRSTIFDCVKSTAKQGVITIGVQGGYYEPPKKYYDFDLGFFPYYYYEGQLLNPPIQKIEKEISKYIDDNLPRCLDSKDYSAEVSFSKPTTKTQIQEKSVKNIINLDITISKNNKTNIIKLENKEFYTESYLKGMIEIADYLTEYHKIDPKYHCLNCLSKMAYDRNLNVDMIPFIEDKVIEVIIHENITNSPNLAAFIYLNKYTGNEKSPTVED